MSEDHGDIYTNTEDDQYPGARQRSRPGRGPDEAVYDRVSAPDGRQVSSKPVNTPFLAGPSRRLAHAERKAAQSRARAENPSSIPWTTIFILLAFIPLLSNFLTSTWTFGLDPTFLRPYTRSWTHSPLNPWAVGLRDLTEAQLSMYDGREDAPVYIGIDGLVFDVSSNRRVYGKGGSYNMMAGRDAARSFVTGCFKTHLTHDLREMSEDELKSWKSFFLSHPQYSQVGTVRHAPIDPRSQVPPPCRPESEGPGGSNAHHPGPLPGPVIASER